MVGEAGIAGSRLSDDLVRDAYVYGYSIDEAYRFLYETTIKSGVPLNEFQLMRDLADDTYADHPTINNDTLHLQGWFDVAAEPVVVSVPDFDAGRYWILHTMDLGHYTTAMIGSRTRGTKGGWFLFAARAWDGEVPDGIDEVVRSDSDLIKVMGRIMTTGGDDLPAAQRLQELWKLQTLSGYLGQSGPASVRREYPDPEKTNWLQRVNFVLTLGSMPEADQNWLPAYAPLGLEPGRTVFTSEQLAAAERGQQLGMDHIKTLAPTLTSSKGVLGTREELQDAPRDVFAVGTYLGQWGLPPVESVYLVIQTASDGLPFNGSNGKKYRAEFPAPDVSEFWSFTVYRADNRLMAHNSLNRHSRGDRTLTPRADGIYTIELGADVDANAANPNFLPLPEQDTYLVLRLYGPSEPIQSGEYTAPRVMAVDES